MRMGSNNGENFAFFDPLRRIWESWWRRLYEVFVPRIGSKHRYTSYPAAVGNLVTRWTVGKIEEEPPVKHI